MKIVQSLWSRPSFNNEHLNISDRSKGGWKDKKYNYISWALSCLQFRKFYNEVELVTDKAGYDLLINKLELPYTHTKIVLDDLNHYHTGLWSLGKIYTYSLQNSPFIHADGDVYIWKKFDEEFEHSELLAQNIESNFNHYNGIFDSIINNFNFIPDVLLKSKSINSKIIAVNAGILGGSDVDFFKLYSTIALEFIDKNYTSLKKIDIGLFNNIFEQFLFYSLAEEKKYKINYLLDHINQYYDGLADLIGVPNQTKFVHTVGIHKRNKFICNLLEFRLQKDYPDYYYKILNLLRTSQI